MSRQQQQPPQQQQQTETAIPADNNNGLEVDESGEETVLSSEGEAEGQAAPWVLDGPEDTGDELEGEEGFQNPVLPQTRRQGQGQPQSQQQGNAQPFEIRTKTGHVFRGATAQEALDAATDHMDRIGGQFAPTNIQYQGRSQQQTPPRRRGGYESAPAPSAEWSDEKYFTEFAKNPRAAMEMMMAEYFGEAGIDDPRQALSTSYSTSVQVSDRIAIADFLASVPEFPASDQSAALLTQRLAADGADLTTFNLEVAYRQLVREGVLAPVPVEPPAGSRQPDYRSTYQQPGPAPAPQPQRQQVQQQRPPQRGAAAPPTPTNRGPRTATPAGGTGQQIGDVEINLAQFEDLSATQMRQYLQRRAQLSGRR